ncbi:MAG: 16S rRNA (guanine(527)-N(7))-methyltransferase RsmG [Bacteroidales bacterium]|nr:16S rRNA (guanine(527)-N(7))-methyltransferase RsmG [Bacteroidales bacterium]
MELIKKYFPELQPDQLERVEHLHAVYECWNQKLNLISRKDFAFFYERHVLHSLAIAKAFDFPAGTTIMDAGTGGGFPGIPLAIFFPEINFCLVDSVLKKIKAVEAISGELGLTNLVALNQRVENVDRRFNFIVSRAVAPLAEMIQWTGSKLIPAEATVPKPGIIYLKGGEVHQELSNITWNYRVIPIRGFFEEEFFSTKLIVYLTR